jgi:hypothetical protein
LSLEGIFDLRQIATSVIEGGRTGRASSASDLSSEDGQSRSIPVAAPDCNAAKTASISRQKRQKRAKIRCF